MVLGIRECAEVGWEGWEDDARQILDSLSFLFLERAGVILTSMNSPRSSALVCSSCVPTSCLVSVFLSFLTTPFLPSLLFRGNLFFLFGLSIDLTKTFNTGSLKQSRNVSKLCCSSGAIASAMTSYQRWPFGDQRDERSATMDRREMEGMVSDRINVASLV
jgi:hypothetical protein